MQDEIQSLWDAIKGLNTDIRGLHVEVAKLKVELVDARHRIEAMRNTADLRAPIHQPQEVARASV